MKRSITSVIIILMAACAFAQDLYIGSFYVTTTDEEKLYGDGKNRWTTRKSHICNMFKYEMPDVLGLQSATEGQLTSIKTGMNSGMTGLASYNLACGILYNNTCQLDTCGTIDGLPDSCTCSWAKLRKEETDFYVFNIYFTPDSAQQAVNHLRTSITAMELGNAPIFIVGYLGVNETKTAYTRMTGRYPDSYIKATYKSAEYGTVNNFDLENNHGSNRYDFVFVSKNITVKAYGQLQSAYFSSDSGAYTRRLPSTHFPVMAKVKM